MKILFLINFLLGYICYTRGFIMTILICLTSPPLSLYLILFPSTLKAIARGLFVLFHISIWSPSTIYPHLNLLHSPTPDTHCTYFTGVSQCIPARGIFYFGPFKPFHYSPLLLYLPTPYHSIAENSLSIL
jgi:hypothetical protein